MRRGISLAEILVASALLVLAGAMVYRALHIAFRSYRLQSSKVVESRDLAMFVTRLDSDLATSHYPGPVPAAYTVPLVASPLVMNKNTDDIYAPVEVSYYYDPPAKRILRQIYGMAPHLVLEHVEVFRYKAGNAAGSVLVQTQMTSSKTPLEWETEWANQSW